MNNKKSNTDEKDIIVAEPTSLDKPQNDTEFAHNSAKLLVRIVKQNGWSRKLGGQSEHLQYEAWQTVGKYYGYTVKTSESLPVEIDGVKGFKAIAKVINENTGIEVGGAEAYCMRDEFNWTKKPMFQLASMAQTRAGSKALRQILGFVVALAGYSPTPSEEMEETPVKSQTAPVKETVKLIQFEQLREIKRLMAKKGKTQETFQKFIKTTYKKDNEQELTFDQANYIITRLSSEPDVVNPDDVPENLGI